MVIGDSGEVNGSRGDRNCCRSRKRKRTRRDDSEGEEREAIEKAIWREISLCCGVKAIILKTAGPVIGIA